jgi:hypothetical protein
LDQLSDRSILGYRLTLSDATSSVDARHLAIDRETNY